MLSRRTGCAVNENKDTPVLRTLIVDDEPVARQILREELEAFPEVMIVGEAENGRQALDRIREHDPNLVLLDLQMPVMTGFEVVQNLRGSRLPSIVMVTAYDQFAIRAFEAGAIDYLLKPVSQDRLARAIERVQRAQGNSKAATESVMQLLEAAPIPSAPRTRKLVGRSGDEYFLLDLDEVLALQAEGSIVWVYTAKRRLMATQNLKAIEARLGASQFQRVHRNAILNVNHVRKMSSLSSQRWLLTLSNGQEFIVSKRQARNVREILHW